MRPKTKDEIMELINEADLSRISNKIEYLIMDSIQIITNPDEDENIKKGASKIGGLPDLPQNIEWPKSGKTPLAFLTQINLKEISEYNKDGLLPDKGILYFFYDAENQPWGHKPSNKSKWKVIYYNNDNSNLSRRNEPENLHLYNVFNPCRLEFKKDITFPDFESVYLDLLNLSKDDEKNIYSFFHKLVSDEEKSEIRHRFLGFPDTIEGDMMIVCQMVSNGIDFDNLQNYNNSEIETLKKGANDWQLLLQLDSDDINIGVSWGNFGRLYFWIKKDDLKNKNFDNVWVILQST
jgi:uncharacterized protein YwqG